MWVVEVSVSGGEVEIVFGVVVSNGFWISEMVSGVVFEVCRDVETVRFAVVTDVLKADIGVVVACEVNFVVLMVSEAVCVLLLDITVGVVVFSVTVKVCETLGVSVLEVLEVRGDETSTVGVVACVELTLVVTGSTGRVLTLVGSLLEVDEKVWLVVGTVVVASGVEDSGRVVVEVIERDAETGLVCTVLGDVGLSVLLGALVVLSVDASGIEEEEDVVNVVMVSTSTGLAADEVSFSVVGMCVVGVEAVVMDSGVVLDVDDIETAGTLKVEIAEDDVDVMAVLGGVKGATMTGLMPKINTKSVRHC